MKCSSLRGPYIQFERNALAVDRRGYSSGDIDYNFFLFTKKIVEIKTQKPPCEKIDLAFELPLKLF